MTIWYVVSGGAAGILLFFTLAAMDVESKRNISRQHYTVPQEMLDDLMDISRMSIGEIEVLCRRTRCTEVN